MSRGRPRWASPETEFRLVRSGTPVTADGFKLGSPTGEIVCEGCSREAHHIEAIRHEPDCPNGTADDARPR